MSYETNPWEEMYLNTSPKDLPWNAGGPDPDLVRLVQSGRIARGQALDMGTGPGHDAVYLIQQGFDVIGVDISSSAITLARENASLAGVFGFFQTGDIRQIPVEDGFIDFVNDRGCFHVLNEADRPLAVDEMARVLHRRGLLLLRVMSDKQPGTEGPHRFTQKEVENLFSPRFKIVESWEGVFEGPVRPKSYSFFMERK